MNQEVHAADYGGHEAELRGSQSVSVLAPRSTLNTRQDPPTFQDGVDMDERVSSSIRGRARKNHSLLLQSMRDVSQARVAELIGVSEGTLSTMKNDQLERFCALVAACGLRLAPVTHQLYDESVISAIKTLAAIGLGRDLRQDEGADE